MALPFKPEDIPLTRMTQTYPGIAKACLMVALDNGGINRERPIGMWAGEFSHWLEHFHPIAPLEPIEKWYAQLTDEQVEVVCTDTEDPSFAALHREAPVGALDLLSNYFDPGPC